MDANVNELKNKLLSSLLLFTKTFYKLRNGREFALSYPIGRESHYITVARELTNCFKLVTNRLIINIPPGMAKSTMLKYFIAWCFAHYPDCHFIYLSYSHDLAATHTADIKAIMELREYKDLFGIEISKESSAKDNFKTAIIVNGKLKSVGALKAYGSSGAVTGQDAGLPGLKRFSGALIMDDMHKPDEVHSDGVREGVIQNYDETIAQRPRDPKNVPMIFIGQRLHEADLAAYLIDGKDGYPWKKVILKAIDDAGNSIHPELAPISDMAIKKRFKPYVFSSQFQQDPLPAGGALFKKTMFAILDDEPKMLATFLTVDTAETEKTYNDATVFSFWGLYKINQFGEDTDVYGIHWLDCLETWIEPKDLLKEFTQFYTECMRYPVKPSAAAIEKKSTGVSLISFLGQLQGINVLEVERTGASGSKSDRFIGIQDYIARKQVSFTKGARHSEMCINHMSKITANNTHRHDDIADTCYDAVDLGLIRKMIGAFSRVNVSNNDVVNKLRHNTERLRNLRLQARG